MAVAIAATARAAAAQTDWSVDAALSRLKPAGATRRDAVALSALAQQQFGSITPMLSAAATVAGDSVAAAQLLFGASALPPWSNRMPFDAGYVVALYGIAAGDRGQSRTIFARQHLLTARGGYWIGGAFGFIDRTSLFKSNEVDGAAWLRFGGHNRITGEISTTRTDDIEVFHATSIPAKPFVSNVRVGDVTVTVEHTGTRFDTEITGGMRMGLEGSSGAAGFGNASIGWRITTGMSVVVSGGSRFADPLRGTPEWKFVSLGVRLRNSPARPADAPNRVGPPLTAERMSDGKVMVTVDAPPNAKSVDIVGTLTGWEPVALVHGAGGWTLSMDVAAGPHQVQVRVDGLEWRPPSNLGRVADEYGQRSGLIVIP